MARLGIIGIGNPLAGDDGAGVEALRLVQQRLAHRRDLFFHVLTGDLLEMAELLERASQFLFLDALAGDTPGVIKVLGASAPRAFSTSFHQTDIGTVMQSLESLGLAQPFPQWEIWGIVIAPPTVLETRLSAPVEQAVHALVDQVCRRVEILLSPAALVPA